MVSGLVLYTSSLFTFLAIHCGCISCKCQSAIHRKRKYSSPQVVWEALSWTNREPKMKCTQAHPCFEKRWQETRGEAEREGGVHVTQNSPRGFHSERVLLRGKLWMTSLGHWIFAQAHTIREYITLFNCLFQSTLSKYVQKYLTYVLQFSGLSHYPLQSKPELSLWNSVLVHGCKIKMSFDA